MLFCLGGRDLEMVEIAKLVQAQDIADLADDALSWDNAKASVYWAKIEAALLKGRAVFLVELKNDLPEEVAQKCHWIDHHGERAGAKKPTAIEQVFEALDLPPSAWTSRLQQVAANDRGWIPELRALGASEDDIRAIRAEDRATQGTTKAEEETGRIAFDQLQPVSEKLLLARLPHNRTATVADRLALATPPDQTIPNLLIISPRGLHFSGEGKAVQALTKAFKGSWSGGALPERGFWGNHIPPAEEKEVIRITVEALDS